MTFFFHFVRTKDDNSLEQMTSTQTKWETGHHAALILRILSVDQEPLGGF